MNDVVKEFRNKQTEEIQVAMYEALEKEVINSSEEMTPFVDILTNAIPLSPLEQVLEFHSVFNHPIGNVPHITHDAITEFKRIGYMEEEIDEFRKALGNQSVIECADALCDLLYFVLGTFIQQGLHHKMKELFDEVHASNMSKVCSSENEANQTLNAYENGVHPEKLGESIKGYIEKVGDYYVIKRQDNDKILKNLNYFKPTLSKILSDIQGNNRFNNNVEG